MRRGFHLGQEAPAGVLLAVGPAGAGLDAQPYISLAGYGQTRCGSLACETETHKLFHKPPQASRCATHTRSTFPKLQSIRTTTT
jgi:hypothetical protein